MSEHGGESGEASHTVGDLAVAHAQACPGALEQVGYVAHALHAAGHHSVMHACSTRLGSAWCIALLSIEPPSIHIGLSLGANVNVRHTWLWGTVSLHRVDLLGCSGLPA